MTNKEYIRWLKLLNKELTFDGLVDGKDEMDMHEMIFDLCEKLEQEPCEDCISRSAYIEELKKDTRFFMNAYSGEFGKMPNNIKYRVDEITNCIARAISMPSVQPNAEQEPKTGHWINGFCSKCGKEAITEWNETGGELCLSDFCPNCGTKMESEVPT